MKYVLEGGLAKCQACDERRKRDGEKGRIGAPCDICAGTAVDFIGRPCRHCALKSF